MDRLLNLGKVLSIVGMGRSTFYGEVKAGRFPKPVHLTDKVGGSSRVAWVESEVQSWIERRNKARDTTTSAESS
jgi:prophage regulatory protein